jgi:2-haloacid dehalogenase
VLAFDTGGAVLDWYGGLVVGLAECGARRGVEHDWHGFANEHRRRSLKRMLGAVEPGYNIDEVHRDVLDELLGETVIDAFSPEDRRTVAQRCMNLRSGRILCRR